MEHTGNFQLSQWESTDRIQRQDFNSDNLKIDAALAALSAASAGHGNCMFCHLTHTGNGTSGDKNPTRLTFPWRPELILVVRADRVSALYALSGSVSSYDFPLTANIAHATVTWSDNTAVISATTAIAQFNDNGIKYYIFGFGAKT